MITLNKKNKRRVVIGVLALGLVSVSGSLLYFAFKDPSIIQVIEKNTNQTKYVLVNEDDGQNFEGAPYNLGNDFVTSISQDTKNHWETANRNTAEIGLEKGQYDAMIVIPKDFSKNILSLQSISPEKAKIEYKIRDGQTQVTNQSIQNNVNSVLYDFNKRIVQMYFSSIVGSLAEAQQNLNNMMDVDSKSRKFLQSKIQEPFQTFSQSINGVSSLANTMHSNTDSVEANQKNFLDSLKDITQNESPSNDSVDANKINDNQSVSGNSLIDSFYSNTMHQYGLLKDLPNSSKNTTQENEHDSIYKRFVDQSKRFEENQGERRKQLDDQIQSVQGQLKSLKNIQSSIAYKYYGDGSKTPETSNVTDSKYAIASLMNSRQDSKLSVDYLNNIDSTVQTVPISGLENLVSNLLKKGVITDSQASKYNSEIGLVRKYSSDRGVSTSGTSIDLVETDNTSSNSQVAMTVTLKTSSDGDTLTLTGDNISLINGADVASQIQSSLNQQLSPFNRTASVSNSGNSISIQVSQHNVEKVEAVVENSNGISSGTSDDNTLSDGENSTPTDANSTSDSTSTSSNTEKDTSSSSNQKSSEPSQAIPDFIPVTVNVVLSVGSNTTENQSYTENEYSWTNNSGIISTGKLATLDAKNSDINKNLPVILANFNSLEQASQQITTIFSEPNESVEGFAGRVVGNGLPITEIASSNSIYYRYNNSELKSLAGNVSDSFAQSYKNDGDQLYKSIGNQVSELEKFLGNENSPSSENSLYGQLNSLIQKGEYYQLLTDLSDWHTKTTELLESYYQSDKKSEGNDKQIDSPTTADVAKQFENIQNSTNDLSTNTKNAVEGIANDNSEVKDFASTTERLQSDANTLLGNVNQYASDTGKNLKENKEYAESFSKVLANAKNGGADNLRVFNFLSSPIDISAVKGTTAKLSIVPYYMTFVGALIMLSTSYFIINLIKPRQVAIEDKLKRTTRYWSNTPNMIRINVVAISVATVFSVFTLLLIRNVSTLSWLLYTFLFMYGTTVGFTYILRVLKRTTALYIFVFLFGVYLLLMPIIGTSTKDGSLIALIYRLSPFQNIENGYTALVSGAQIGYKTLLAMLMFGVFVNALNWYKKNIKRFDSSQ